MIPVSLAPKVKLLTHLLNQNSSTILTGIGVIGTVGTAYLTGRATFKAADTINFERGEFEKIESEDPKVIGKFRRVSNVSRIDQVKLVWPHYIPPVTAGVLTITSIVVAHRIDAKRIAALTIASGISERALREYKEKVVEKLGERQDRKIRDEVAQDRVTKDPPPIGPSTNELILSGDGQVLCKDMLTGRYFMSTSEALKSAENAINHELNYAMYASLSEFYDRIGLSSTPYSDSVGWNADKLLSLDISATIAQDGRPCLAVNYDPHPFQAYVQRHHD